MSSNAIESRDQADASVTCLKNYLPKFGVRPNNLLTLDEARGYHERGEQYVLLFGDPKAPDYYIQMYHSIAPTVEPGLSVYFLDGKETLLNYKCSIGRKDEPFGGLLVSEFCDYRMRSETGTPVFFWIEDAFSGRGPLPSVHHGRTAWFDLLVPWQDFLIGDYPSFDELVEGAFIERLPRIDLPPAELLAPFDPQNRSAPPPEPRGHFPW